MAKNITLAVADDVLEKVRLLAAQEKTTVNALVRGFLESKARESDVGERRRSAIVRLLDMSRNSSAAMQAGWTFDREDLYAERVSRHEHPSLRGGGSD